MTILTASSKFTEPAARSKTLRVSAKPGFSLAGVALLLACSGCSLLQEQPSASTLARLKVSVKTTDDSGRAVPGAEIVLSKKQLGVTDTHGVLVTTLAGRPGTIASLSVKCPSGFTSPEKTLDVGITQLAASSPMPQLDARCTALTHELVLGIRAENGADLPILYLGKEVGRTDTNGVAHVVVRVPPGETGSVELDTRAKPGLTPPNPSLVFKAGNKDELVLLQQKFTLPKRQIVVHEVARPKPL